jgi:hypothetical protein
MYAKNIEKEEIKNLWLKGFMIYLSHESCSFIERRGWNVILFLWYFKLYSTQNNTYCTSAKYIPRDSHGV